MDKNAVLQNQNVSMILIAMIVTLAPKIFACPTMDSADTLQDVRIPMNAPLTYALLLLMEIPTLALILLFLAHKMQPSLILTLYCFLMMKKLNGLESATRPRVVLLALSMLNAIIIKDVSLPLANNSTVLTRISITLGVILNQQPNLSIINLSLDWKPNYKRQVMTLANWLTKRSELFFLQIK